MIRRQPVPPPAFAVLVGAMLLSACSILPAATEPAPPSATGPPGGTVDAAEVYRRVAPSLARIEVDGYINGSGVLLDERHVVTNAHVVWPHEEVTLFFPDGGRFDDVPVVGVDLMGDLAVIDLGTGATTPPPLPARSGDDPPLGSGVYLVGYPIDAMHDVTPSITGGILSRNRTWRDTELTFRQTDTLTSGGQSGGALVDAEGELLGISTMVLDGFVLSLDATDVLRLTRAVIDGDDVWGLGDRSIAALTGPVVESLHFRHRLVREAVFVEVSGRGDAPVNVVPPLGVALEGRLTDLYGWVEASMDLGDDAPSLDRLDLFEDEIYILTVEPVHPPEGGLDVDIHTPHTLYRVEDPDDGRHLKFDTPVVGVIDHPADADWYLIHLEAGDTVEVAASSYVADVELTVDFVGGDGDPVAYDWDSGGGVMDSDALAEFAVERTGLHLISVYDQVMRAPGAYILTVRLV